jgi:hypothetical protein
VWLFARPVDWARAQDGVCEGAQSWRVLLGVPGGALPAPLLFVRWLLRAQLRPLAPLYSTLLLTRADFFHLCPHPPVAHLDPAALWTIEAAGGPSERHQVFSTR